MSTFIRRDGQDAADDDADHGDHDGDGVAQGEDDRVHDWLSSSRRAVLSFLEWSDVAGLR